MKQPHSNAGRRRSSVVRRGTKPATRLTRTNIEQMAPDKIQRLVHELQVHQVELEMQNEELRTAHEELETANERYAELYNFAPVGFLIFNEQGIVREANTTMCRVLGLEKAALVGLPFHRFLADESINSFRAHRRALFATGKKQVLEVVVRKSDGTMGPVLFESIICRPAKGHEGSGLVAVIDIAERRAAEMRLATYARRQTAIAEFGQRALSGEDEENLTDDVIRFLAESLQLHCNAIREILSNTERLMRDSAGRKRDERETIAPMTFDSEEIVLIKTLANILKTAMTRKKSEENLLKLSAAAEQSSSMIVIADAGGIIEYVNHRFVRHTEFEANEILGTNLCATKFKAMTPELYDDMWRKVIAGTGWQGDVRNKTKSGRHYWETITVSPIRDSRGKTANILLTADDVTERLKSDKLKETQLAELDHNIKNILAAVLSIARQTLSSTTSLEHFKASFTSRLLALSEMHRIVHESKAKGGVMLHDIVMAATKPYREVEASAITVGGEDVVLSEMDAQLLYMAFHELATNAAKYGALSVPEGGIEVHWELDNREEQEMLEIHWTESGLHGIQQPERRGFGRDLIEHMISYQLHGRATMDFQDTGLQCNLRVPHVGVSNAHTEEMPWAVNK